MWENSTPTHNDFSKIQEEFKRAKKTVRNMSFCKWTIDLTLYSYCKWRRTEVWLRHDGTARDWHALCPCWVLEWKWTSDAVCKFSFLFINRIECQKHHCCDRVIVKLKARILVKVEHRSLQSLDTGVWRRCYSDYQIRDSFQRHRIASIDFWGCKFSWWTFYSIWILRNGWNGMMI